MTSVSYTNMKDINSINTNKLILTTTEINFSESAFVHAKSILLKMQVLLKTYLLQQLAHL